MADWALNDVAFHAIQQGFDVRIPKLSSSAMVHRARNIALTRVRPNADYVLFCDDDMAPYPEALVQLLNHERPAVSGLCTSREVPPKIAAAEYNEETDRFGRLEAVKPDKLLTGNLVAGAAFLLVQRTLLDEAIAYHLGAHDWLEENRRVFDRLKVPAVLRAQERQRLKGLRRAAWEANRSAKVFRFRNCDDDSELGEDYHFAWILLKLGHPIAIDTGCIISHIGDFPYNARQLGVLKPDDVEVKQ
jgi:glycosyltransferase involved in cell wall biosynthesis